MKTLLRYIIGIAAGVGVAFLLPADDRIAGTAARISEIVLSAGKYFLLPLIFFSLPVAVTRLRRIGRLGRLMGRVGLSILISTAFLALVGTAAAWLINLGRVPVIPGEVTSVGSASFDEIVRSIIQIGERRILRREGALLMPLIVPAFILGWHFHHDKEVAEPAYNLFDSLSRVFYRANRYLLLLMPGLLALLAAYTVLGLRMVADLRRFSPLLILIFGIALFLLAAVYPLLLWIFDGRKSPWPTLRGLSGALLSSFGSASPLFSYGNLVFHLKENLGIPRHGSALSAPACLMFARGGTAMITALCMITVIRSYSSLEITLFQTAWTALFSFLVSFALPTFPDRGLITALAVLGGMYGRGLDDGWLILAPVLPILMMVSAVLNTATGAVVLYLANRHSTE